MARLIIFPSVPRTSTCRHSRVPIWLVCLTLLVIISISCGIDLYPPGTGNQINPAAPAGQEELIPVGFEEKDCIVDGVIFSDIQIYNTVDEINNGPSIICNSSSTGSHGETHASIIITSFQTNKLAGYYQDQKKTITTWVDEATQWNSDPGMPEEVKDVISILYDQPNGYIFMITSQMQDCVQGRGFGTMMLFNKYLANIQYSSCELADAGAYLIMMQNLQTAAMVAVGRVEEANKTP